MVKLFGAENLGNGLRTNSKRALLPLVDNDNTGYILNWYARHNVSFPVDSPARHAFWQWTESTAVTLRLSNKPMRVLPLSDLLARCEGMRFEPGTNPLDGAHHAEIVDDVARRMWVVHTRPAYHTDIPAALALLSEGVRDRWRELAMPAFDVLKPPTLMIVPPRMAVQVDIDMDPRALGAMLESLPTNIAPEALVWVHIEGFSRRDVC